MQNFDKTFVPFGFAGSRSVKFYSRLKIWFLVVFPFCLLLLPFGLFLLLGQAVVVGVADRLGISPKLSLIFSSLFYVSVFSGLALLGAWPSKLGNISWKPKIFPPVVSEPICKILIIKRKVNTNDEI